MTISAHIIDWANGIAAAGVRVRLERHAHVGWAHVGSGTTGSRGRITDWLTEATAPAPACVYRMIIDTSAYFASLGAAPLYHDITITFAVSDPGVCTEVTVAAASGGYMAYLERGGEHD
jgi:5-hydroxyisourate hydrolase